MEIVKMFEWTEIEDELNSEIDEKHEKFNLCKTINYCGGNDVATFCYVYSQEEIEDKEMFTFTEAEKRLNNYFLKHGCKPGEKVWIDITW